MSLLPQSREARFALGWIAAITLFRIWFAPHLDLVEMKLITGNAVVPWIGITTGKDRGRLL